MILTTPLLLLCQIKTMLFHNLLLCAFLTRNPNQHVRLLKSHTIEYHGSPLPMATNDLSHLNDFVTCDNACTASLTLLTLKGQTFYCRNDVFNFHPVSRGHGVVAIIRGFFSEAGCKNKLPVRWNTLGLELLLALLLSWRLSSFWMLSSSVSTEHVPWAK